MYVISIWKWKLKNGQTQRHGEWSEKVFGLIKQSVILRHNGCKKHVFWKLKQAHMYWQKCQLPHLTDRMQTFCLATNVTKTNQNIRVLYYELSVAET